MSKEPNLMKAIAKDRGRPRSFDPQKALKAGMALIWAQGYSATSLDELVYAMSLSRSSFYSLFKSKKEFLICSLEFYSKHCLDHLQLVVESNNEKKQAFMAVLRALSNLDNDENGCYVINMLNEVAPHHIEVTRAAEQHLERVKTLIGDLLEAGKSSSRSTTYVDSAIGTVIGVMTLKKASWPRDRLMSILQHFVDAYP